jgi:hypothetical protein
LLATWDGTLARFGVDAQLVSHDRLRTLPRLGRSTLLVVDEAHRFRNRSAARHRSLLRVSGEAALLLVTATPLCNSLDDVAVLARIAFADDAAKPYGVPSIDFAFERGRESEIRSLLAILGVRRCADSEFRLPVATRSVIRFPVGAAELGIARRIDDFEVPLCEKSASAIVRSHLRARLESSPDAFAESLRRQRRFYRRAREKLAAGFGLRRRDFDALLDADEREMFQELLFPDAFLPKAETDSSLVRSVDAEIARIDAALASARGMGTGKFDLLRAALDRELLPAVVFTRAIATATRLWEIHRGDLRTAVASSRVAVDPAGRKRTLDDLLAAFRARRIDLLVLTDLASEGLDLQAAATIVHFDLPWTAVKLDQRNGRAVRIGQVRPSVRAIYFVPAVARKGAPLVFVTRKERLARRYLDDSSFGPPLQAAVPRFVSCRDSVLLADMGAIIQLGGQSLTADPRQIRQWRSEPVVACERGETLWAMLRHEASLLPSRVERGAPIAVRMLGRRVCDSHGGHALADRRERYGIELALLEPLEEPGASSLQRAAVRMPSTATHAANRAPVEAE